MDDLLARLDMADDGSGLLREAMAEIERLQLRNDELESLAGDSNLGLWRFWNAKSQELAAKLTRVEDELRLSRTTEEAALAVIGLDKPEKWKQGYVEETFAQEHLEIIIERTRETAFAEAQEKGLRPEAASDA